jgi:hypothetical protein
MARNLEEEFQHYHASITEGKVSRAIEGSYNRVRDQFLRETGQGLLTVAGSGFGKGVLTVAVSAIVGAATLMAGLAFGGGFSGEGPQWLTQAAQGLFQGAGPVSVPEAAINGGLMGAQFLGSTLGISMMLGVGAANGFSAWRKQKNEVAEAMAVAQSRAVQKELAKFKAHQPEITADEPTQTKWADKHPSKTNTQGFAAAELRKQQLAAEPGIQGVA